MDIILEESPIIDQAKKPEKQNQKESSSSTSCNFERLYSEMIEVQSDIESLDEGVQKFFTQYIGNIVNPNEIKNTAKIIKQNKAFQDKIYDNFKSFLEIDLKENKEKVEKGMKITKQIETKTYQVARAKDMFRELNEMIHGDIISHQKEINKISDEIKKIQEQVVEYEKEIVILSNENKTSYNEELNLLDTVMSFGKKMYTTYATREEKKKEKNNLEAEILKLKEEQKEKDIKFQEAMNLIKQKEEKEQYDFQKKKRDIELYLNLYPSTCDEYDSILKILNTFCSKKLEKYNQLQNTEKEKQITNIPIDINELKEHIYNCDNKILQELLNSIEIIRNIHPYLNFPPNIDINNIVDTVESISNQMSCIIKEETPQEKINAEKEKQMEELGTKIADVYYDKFIKHLFFNALKMNSEEEKKKKEAEKKMQELKNKEEKLKQLKIKYINEQTQNINNNNNSQISDSSNCTDLDNIKNTKENEKKSYPPSPKIENNYPQKSTTNNSTTNNKIKDKKKEEKEKVKEKEKEKEKEKRNKNKFSNINVILEEDDSKSKIKDIRDAKDAKNAKKENFNERDKENETTEKKNYRQKSYKKKGKISQNKKRKNKKNKKNEEDYYNDTYFDNYDENNYTQVIDKGNESPDKDNNKAKQKQTNKNYYESDARKYRNQYNLPKNCFEEKIENDSGETFDLNDLDFLAELGEELNKSEKTFGFGRKNNYRK